MFDDRESVVRELLDHVVRLMPDVDPAELYETSDLRDYAGFDSIVILQLLTHAEETFGVSLMDNDAAIESASSIGKLAECVVEQLLR